MNNKIIFLIIFSAIAYSCNSSKKKENVILEINPNSIKEIRKENMYEYDSIEFYYYNDFEKGGKNIFFSNVRPDDIYKSKNNKPLSLSTHLTSSPKVLEYFDKELNNEFIYYHYRNDTLISRLYLIEYMDQKYPTEKIKINTEKDLINFFNKVKLKYKKIRVNDFKEIEFLIENKYLAYVFLSKTLFYIEIYYKDYKTLGYNLSLH